MISKLLFWSDTKTVVIIFSIVIIIITITNIIVVVIIIIIIIFIVGIDVVVKYDSPLNCYSRVSLCGCLVIGYKCQEHITFILKSL